MTAWFGKRHDAPVYDDAPEAVPTPVGQRCWSCGVAFVDGDDGFQMPAFTAEVGVASYHRDCLLAMVLGGPADTVKERYGLDG